MKQSKASMASLLSLLCTIFVILLATVNSPVRASKEFKVGGTVGWRQPRANDSAIYSQWAARNRFRVGDSLRFQYRNDSVLVVDKWGYYHCNMTTPISAFNDGNTVVNLDKAGPAYFISGDPDHCNEGQRLDIEVMPLHPIHHTPPSIASPPQPDKAESLSPLSSSGTSVSVVLVSVSLTLGAAFVILVSSV